LVLQLKAIDQERTRRTLPERRNSLMTAAAVSVFACAGGHLE